jgi:transcriptional regulator with XRE-family HTH domain
MDLNHQIAARVRQLRAKHSLSLEELANRSGVSRSMISLIERGKTSATAVVLEKLAAGLGITLAALFEPPAATAEPLMRKSDQAVWRDPDSGYARRNVSPSGALTPIQIVEVAFPAGAHVAYETGSRNPAPHQQVWVLDGQIDVTVGSDRHELREGDCLAFALDRPTAFHNRTRKAARYVVVIAS